MAAVALHFLTNDASCSLVQYLSFRNFKSFVSTYLEMLWIQFPYGCNRSCCNALGRPLNRQSCLAIVLSWHNVIEIWPPCIYYVQRLTNHSSMNARKVAALLHHAKAQVARHWPPCLAFMIVLRLSTIYSKKCEPCVFSLVANALLCSLECCSGVVFSCPQN